ncbi:hypothetical protein HKJ32_00865 [Xylella fastidiosa subsp. multiplex]|uniref:hypothetical protein n=1 Tax=Xylella fastidiosa TaxID=2371 RepID=UPI001462D2EA|nr:hypothetical protein [Xylella fastidiosa]MBE0269897.1 hypothetical protein [Xylella fastidiosa subsp. multiplex]MBE0276503.1 hypothetical protein [Xylella fastidiosa subsp. multiplex]MBE0278708.1 hypothetical protein [Xylella fastidiosa subsp. multiplex]MBE0283121.1 hypothetical protein [Xylella fastidiosa subsp. multiplex]QJP49619.1 hypothetical protein HKJ33_00875 [Xylella fastidiosa subsp. multiplex]
MTGIGYSSYNDPRLQPPQDDAKEYFAEQVDARVQDYLSDPEKIEEADEWVAGTLSAAHYKEMEIVLADLHALPSDQLIDSDVLTRMYALAQVQGLARLRQLHLLAEQEIKEEMRHESECFHTMWGDVMQEEYA